MNFPFFVARRYLIAKKSHNIINLISGISMVGVAVGTAALIIVLSVFNGLESAVVSMFSVFDPDVKITAAKGKTFESDELNQAAIEKLPGVIKYTQVVEENALLRYNQQQHLVTIKGVDSVFQNSSPLDSVIVEGQMLLQRDSINFAVVGFGVAYYLNIDLKNLNNLISIYIPKRGNSTALLPEESFNNELIQPAGIFSIQQDFDDKYILVPLRFARQLLEYGKELTSVEIRFNKDADAASLQKQISQIAGKKFKIKSRFEQQEVLYKIMKSEKWAVFLILTFILIVASFNTIGSITMLIMEKKKDISILHSLGAEIKTIRKIFFLEGFMITIIGSIAGLIIGTAVCVLQIQFGIVKLQAGGSFIFSAYPVKILPLDFVYVFLALTVIGFFAAIIPSRQILVSSNIKS